MTTSHDILRIRPDDYDPDDMPVERARAFILDRLKPIDRTERLPILQALDRVLAADVTSPMNVPGHDNSAMDGYALRHADLAAGGATTLEVIGTAFAGKPYAGRLGPGQCLRIMTGAPIPAGADCVVMQENVLAQDGRATIGPGHRSGQNIRRAGEDLAQGGIALAAGRLLRPADLGLLASLGIGQVDVCRRLRVAIFSTGDELVPVGQTLGDGQIHDSNRYSLHGLLARLGCEVVDLGLVRDDPATLEAALREAAAGADAVITSGGVSVGEADFTREVMARLGTVLFWKIAMKPGRPLAYGEIGSAQFFGLPGNPVSVMVTFYQFVRDALLRMQGRAPEPLPTFAVRCTAPLKKAPGRTEFQRGMLRLEGDEWVVAPTGEQGSGILSSMSRANCFIVLEQARGRVEAGETVRVQPFEGLV
ncbi:MAG: molybdopterin molybdotransferase MoeA [Rhodocyclaceae bacterium]|nr:molybdopterin molybdotransferase MoeA [Rhodocyclaceae bacterium]